jgi:hypothetical protein
VVITIASEALLLFVAAQAWWDRLLHNETAYQMQRRLQFAGLPMVVLPVRVLE